MKKSIFVVLVMMIFSWEALAIPAFLTHQGRMVGSNGQALTGSSNVTFSLYSSETGGSASWTQELSVTFDNGYYSIVLGPGTPELSEAFFDGSPFYLGITLDGLEEFSPRNKIASVPYSFRSGSVTGEVHAVGGLMVDDVEVFDSSGNFQAPGSMTLPQGELGDLPSASEDNKGQIYFATDTGTIYYSDGNEWSEVGTGSGEIEGAPIVLSISPSQIEPGSSTDITITGQSFNDGCEVKFADIFSDNVVFSDSTEVTAASTELSSGLYTVKVENPVGLKGLLTDGLEVDAAPVWVTEEGSLGVLMDSALGNHYTLEVNDAEGQDITFSVISGSLPTGITLDSSTGIFSGDADDVSEDIDFTFEVQAVDTAREPHEITRTFSITVTHRLPIDLEMWSGYCSSHGQVSSWNTYCTDVTEWDTTNGKLSVNANGTFTVNEGGYYRINSFAISNGNGNAHTIFYVNGSHRWYSHEHAKNAWSDGFIDVIWKFNPGDTFYISYHNPGSTAYHSGNANGAHSRMQVEYMGPLTDGETLAHDIWSGWCSTHGRGGGWNTYCTNTSEFNSFESNELTINSNGTFTVQKDGYYRVNMFVISNGSGYAHMRLLKNGETIYYGHERVDGTWTDNFIDQTWFFESGDTFKVEVHNPSSYAYHYGRSDGVHSKMQVSYVGPLVMDSEQVPFTWSGYCSTNGTASGYNKYCTDTTEWDNLDGMLEITDDGTFTANQPGYYRINAWTASEGTEYAHVRLQVNGEYRHYGYEKLGGHISDNFMDIIWPLDAGDEFYVEYNNPGTKAYTSGNANGSHSRLQIQFVGDF